MCGHFRKNWRQQYFRLLSDGLGQFSIQPKTLSRLSYMPKRVAQFSFSSVMRNISYSKGILKVMLGFCVVQVETNLMIFGGAPRAQMS